MPHSVVFSFRLVPRILTMIFLVAALLVLPACWVYSVEPLYEEQTPFSQPDPDLVFEPTLLGSWGQIDNDCLWILTISGNKDSYSLKMAPSPACKAEEKTSEYVGHLVKLGDARILDVNPIPDSVCDLCLPLHTFLLVAQENESLNLIPIDQVWLSQAMSDKKVTLGHLENHQTLDTITLTASSKDLKQFMREHVTDRATFKASSDLKLKFKRR